MVSFTAPEQGEVCIGEVVKTITDSTTIISIIQSGTVW